MHSRPLDSSGNHWRFPSCRGEGCNKLVVCLHNRAVQKYQQGVSDLSAKQVVLHCVLKCLQCLEWIRKLYCIDNKVHVYNVRPHVSSSVLVAVKFSDFTILPA
jgi:hypothetical protein